MAEEAAAELLADVGDSHTETMSSAVSESDGNKRSVVVTAVGSAQDESDACKCLNFLPFRLVIKLIVDQACS